MSSPPPWVLSCLVEAVHPFYLEWYLPAPVYILQSDVMLGLATPPYLLLRPQHTPISLEGVYFVLGIVAAVIDLLSLDLLRLFLRS